MTFMPRSMVALAGALLLLGGEATSRADWASDEAYLRKLDLQLADLRSAVAVLERHRRELDMVEAEVLATDLGLADPSGKPDEIVRRELARLRPPLTARMRALPSKTHRGFETWRWECSIEATLPQLRQALALLQQNGLFILPTSIEPTVLEVDPIREVGRISFVGHHVRLTEPVLPKLPRLGGAGLFAQRTDPPAVEIKKRLSEITKLRARIVYIQGFEARVIAIRDYLSHLKSLATLARDPLKALQPLLDLELVHLRRARVEGTTVTLEADVPSESIRQTALRILDVSSNAAHVFRVKSLRISTGAPPTGDLPDPSDATRGRGPKCNVIASRARAVDLASALSKPGGAWVFVEEVPRTGPAAARAAGASGPGPESSPALPTAVSGRLTGAPLDAGLVAGLHALGLVTFVDGDHFLLVPAARSTRAEQALRENLALAQKRSSRGEAAVEFGVAGEPVAQVLTELRGLGSEAIEVPGPVLVEKTVLWLSGRATQRVWLALIAAGLGLRIVESEGTLGLKPLEKEAELLPVPDPDRSRPLKSSRADPGDLSLGSSTVRIVVSGGKRMAVLSDRAGRGLPIVATKGIAIGRKRSTVVKIDERGLTLLWPGSRGQRSRIVLPIGAPLSTEEVSEARRCRGPGCPAAPSRGARGPR
jgi:hypothetical protein